MLILNKNSEIKLRIIGQEKTPVVIIDNVYQDTSSLKDAALNGPGFSQAVNSMYPGLNAPLLPQHISQIFEHLELALQRIYKIPENHKPIPGKCYYGLVNRDPKALTAAQSIPHIDDPDMYSYAVLLYLNDGTFGGTAFYRHIATGFERISSDRLKDYSKIMDSSVLPNITDTGYILDSTKNFEKTGAVSYKANRMVVYPCSLLHSGIIDTPECISDSPESGRLTANLFIHYKKHFSPGN